MALLVGTVGADESYFGPTRPRGVLGKLTRGCGTLKRPVFGVFERATAGCSPRSCLTRISRHLTAYPGPYRVGSRHRLGRLAPTAASSMSVTTATCASKRPARRLSNYRQKLVTGIGQHINALLMRRSSRREKDMPHDEGYGCRVLGTRRIFARPADGFVATGSAGYDRLGG